MDAKLEIEELSTTISEHNHNYYDLHAPTISDFEYDDLVKRLKLLELMNPDLVSSNSPTQKVGGTVSNNSKKVVHTIRMESLDNAFSFAELKEFDQRVTQSVGEVQYVVEMKIDGLSVSLEYKNGVFVRGSTRGDGNIGEDVTDNLMTLKSIPKHIDFKGNLEVRGEVYMSINNFLELNKQIEVSAQTEDSLKDLFGNNLDLPRSGTKLPLSSPRSVAAGALMQKAQNKLSAPRNLDIFIFNLQQISDQSFLSHKNSLDFLAGLNFPVSPRRSVFQNITQAFAEIQCIGEIRGDLPFEIDGAVIKVDDLSKRNTLGSTSKCPRWAIAFKFPAEQKETKLIQVEHQVGRTGIITPTAIVQTVKISGSTINRLTLHNYDFIKEKDIRQGDVVVIQKAGDIIPEIVQVLTQRRTGDEIIIHAPDKCPVCGSQLVKFDEEVAKRCTDENCPAQLLRRIVHFASRGAMNIDGLSVAKIDKLIENDLINDVADLYYLESSSLVALKGFGEKSVQNLINAIELSKQCGLDKLLFALGIKHVGNKMAKCIAQNLPDIDSIISTNEDHLMCIKEIGVKVAKSVVEYFSNPKSLVLVEKLRKAGLKLDYNEILSDKRFENINFVITGSFDGYTRVEIENIIEGFGGKVLNTVSKKTNYLLAGTAAGSKLAKANNLGVKIIDQKTFEQLQK